MNEELASLLRDAGGVLRRQDARRRLSRHVLDHAVAAHHVSLLLPQVYVDTARVGDVELRQRAALLYAGDDAVLSHLTALRRWGLSLPDEVDRDERVHVTVPARIRRRGRQNVAVLHRRHAPVQTCIRNGLPVTRFERAIVDSWDVLGPPHQRAPAIVAVAERMTTPQRLLSEAALTPNRRGRASLLGLCSALANGCRSELEIWGLQHVFDDRRFGSAVRQLPLTVHGRTVYADMAFEREKVIVELDGAAYHGSPDRRAQDVRRDAALAALGWVVLRFTYQRLHAAPEVVRREVLAVLEIRRCQLAA